MKRTTFLLLVIFLTGMANAQSNKEELDLIQSIFGMEKKALVAGFVEVDDANSETFWKLYDEYEVIRKDLGKKRVGLLMNYAESYENMSDETADAWMKEVIKLTASSNKLVTSYYKKIKKATDPITALQFYHIENFILTSIRLEILGEVPFVRK